MSDLTQGWAKIGHHPKTSNKPIIRLPVWKLRHQTKFLKKLSNFLMRNSWVFRLACWLGEGGYLRRDLTLSFPVSCAKMTVWQPVCYLAGGSSQSKQRSKLFLQSSELGLPQPLTHRRVCPPPFGFGGGGQPFCRERGWEGESQFRRGDINCGALYMCVFCGGAPPSICILLMASYRNWLLTPLAFFQGKIGQKYFKYWWKIGQPLNKVVERTLIWPN